MTTSCFKTVPKERECRAKTRRRSNLSYRIESGCVNSEVFLAGVSAARGASGRERGGRGRGHFLHEGARWIVVRETLPERPRLAPLAHFRLEKARFVKDLVEAAVLGIRRENRLHPALRRPPRLSDRKSTRLNSSHR